MRRRSLRRLPLCLCLLALPVFAQPPAAKPAPAAKKTTTTRKSSVAKKPPARRSAAAIPSYRDLRFPPLRPIEIPKVETFTLPNGLRLYLLEDHELPVISGTALIRAGNLFDPPDKLGLSEITGMVLRSGGTTSDTGDALDETLENIAASVEASIGETSGRVSFSCLKEGAGDVLAIFHDILTSPEFRPNKIELAKTQLRSGIARRNDDPDGIADREFSSIVYGRDNPYGWRMEYEHVNRITRDDLFGYYRRYFFPANVMLAVYGDITIAEMRERLEKLFGGWTAAQPAVPPFPPVTAKPAPGVYLAEKADVAQTFFHAGHLGGLLNDKDYAALQVMADILGGGFRSRLFERVRTKLGWAYSIGADWGADFHHPGLFEVSGSTKSSTTTETLQVIEEELARIRDQPATAAELRWAKDKVLNGFVFNFDTRSKTITRLLSYEYNSYPKDFIFQYQKAVAAVTLADVQRVARQGLRLKDLSIVTVGKPADFGKPLSALGRQVQQVDLAIPEPKGDAPPAGAAPASAAGIDKARELLRRAQQAMGGAEKLAAMKDLYQVAEVQLMGGLKVNQKNRWLAPGYFRQEIVLPFGPMTSYSDGKTGWLRGPQGKAPLDGNTLRQVREQLFRILPRLMLSDRDPGRTVNAISADTVEISGSGGLSTRVTFDPATGLPARQVYQTPPGPVEEQWSDFRDVSGLRMPFTLSVTQSGRKFADARVLEFQINTGITPEEMSK